MTWSPDLEMRWWHPRYLVAYLLIIPKVAVALHDQMLYGDHVYISESSMPEEKQPDSRTQIGPSGPGKPIGSESPQEPGTSREPSSTPVPVQADGAYPPPGASPKTTAAAQTDVISAIPPYDYAEFFSYGGPVIGLIGLILCFIKARRILGVVLIVAGVAFYVIGGMIMQTRDFSSGGA